MFGSTTSRIDYICVLVRRMTQFSVWSTLVACARCPSFIWEVVFDYGRLNWQEKKAIEAFNEAPPIATKELWHSPIGVLRVKLLVGVIHGIFLFLFFFLFFWRITSQYVGTILYSFLLEGMVCVSLLVRFYSNRAQLYFFFGEVVEVLNENCD